MSRSAFLSRRQRRIAAQASSACGPSRTGCVVAMTAPATTMTSGPGSVRRRGVVVAMAATMRRDFLAEWATGRPAIAAKWPQQLRRRRPLGTYATVLEFESFDLRWLPFGFPLVSFGNPWTILGLPLGFLGVSGGWWRAMLKHLGKIKTAACHALKNVGGGVPCLENKKRRRAMLKK